MRSISVLNLNRKGLCTFAIAVCVTLAGCQTTQSRSLIEAKHIVAEDPCRQMRSGLIGTQDHFSANIGGGIAMGVVAGIISGLSSRDRNNALKHAIIGGLAGAAAGYLKGKLEQARSREELRNAINSDVRHDTRKVTEMGAILRNLNNCRQTQVLTVKQAFDDGSVTAQETKVALQAVRASVQGDNKLIEEILGGVTERKGVYVTSISKVENKVEKAILADAAGSASETAAVADVRELDRTSRVVHKEHQSASADLFRQIDELEELTLG